jgi:plasmid stabilization system protein ParE
MHRIEVTDRALADADEAYAWLAEHVSSAYAEGWYRGLFAQIEALTRHPRRCPVARESEKFPEEIRELLYGKRKQKNKYRILFTIREDLVVILYVHHASRKELEP